MNDRIELLHKGVLKALSDGEDFFSGKARLDLLAEEGFLEKSFILRKARMTEAVLDAADIRIYPREILVGTLLKVWRGVDYTTFEERVKYADMNLAFPRRNNQIINGEKVYSSSPLKLSEEELRNPDTANWSWGHSCGGFERILEMGYLGIAEEAKRKIEEMKAAGEIDTEKIEFWEALITVTKAVVRYSERYSEELSKMAESETDEKRKRELLKLSEITKKVPGRPAETFYEAVQSVWFAWMCSYKFNGTDLGRLDQYLYPYYERDIAEGRLTAEEAQELIYAFFLKCYEANVATVKWSRGMHPSIMLGGRKKDGVDGTNPITFMCLSSIERFAIPSPKISVRINEDTPHDIFVQTHRMLLKGLNQPDFYADDNVISAYEKIGVPYEDAVSYAQSVCEEISLAGISEDCTNEGPHCDVHDKVILAMKRVWNGEKADTFDDFMVLVEDEIRKCIREEKEFHDLQTEKLRIFSPQPLHSAGIVGCLESGRDIMSGGAKYNNTGSVIGGLATASDGLYAIKKLVYEEGRLTLPEFFEILKDDYKNHELLRLEILNKFPKYGNDIDEVDVIAGKLFDVFADELLKTKNSRGGVYKVGAWASEYRSSYPATPDGRKQGDTFAVNISPTPGRDVKGATAILRSATKLDLSNVTAGGMIDVAMNPACLRGENGADILKTLIMTYSDLGGIGLQFNIFDADTLKDAQVHPENYRNLMVRVWGYNDYFIGLPKDMQAHIISRTIQETL